MSVEEKIAALEEIMDLDEGSLNEESVLEEYEEWDSLSKLSLVAFAKRKFDIVLSTEKMKTFVTVKDICDTLKE